LAQVFELEHSSPEYYYSMAQQAVVVRGLLIIEASRSHSDTPYSVALLWTSDQSDLETCICTTHNTHKRQTAMLPAGFEPAIPAT